MNTRIGVNPIAWSNDDMQELGADITLATCLGEARAAGFEGIELGHKFPRSAAELRPILQDYDIDLIGGWYSAALLKRSAAEEIEAAGAHMKLLKDMGCTIFIMAETTDAVHGERNIPLHQSPVLGAGQWRQFGAAVSEFAARLRDLGFTPAYHHHMGTVVETRDEIDRFMEVTGENMELLLDTGHAMFAGVDPVALARDYAKRITHIHAKDIRLPVKTALERSDSFLDAVVKGVFTVPGDGDVDFASVLKAVSKAGYEGWLVVEAEQDPQKASPETYANLGYANLAALAAGAGL